MFVDNAAIKNFDGQERYDKFALASTMFDISFKGAACSVIESQVLKNCDSCNLKYMCKSIDEVVEEYTKMTMVETDNFSLGNYNRELRYEL